MSHQHCAQVRMRDLVILPHVWEHYDNITHQTLEATRAAALDPAMTHLLKVPCMTCMRSWPQARQQMHTCACRASVSLCAHTRLPGGADSLPAQEPFNCCGNPSGPDLPTRWTTTPMCELAC
jgi:hypothetical protein